MLLIATGMRRGEMLGLMWGFVDLDGERIFIARQYDTDKNLREPKTEKSKRWVSIKGRMADILRAWKAQQADELAAIGLHQTEETPVFANELGQFIDPNNYARWWRNFSVDNGFGVFTKDVRTNRMNGGGHARQGLRGPEAPRAAPHPGDTHPGRRQPESRAAPPRALADLHDHEHLRPRARRRRDSRRRGDGQDTGAEEYMMYIAKTHTIR